MSQRRRKPSRVGAYGRYTSVAERKIKAEAMADTLRKNGKSNMTPVSIEGRVIARSFWGKAWCAHLEKFSDFSNRLPRGRSYLRNGSVIDLKIAKGSITASVAGARVYKIKITITTLPEKRWEFIKQQCAGGIGSALELLQGKISDQVMQTVCDRDNGLFPHPVDIRLDCNCPDWATLCKHLAAVLYGVGARLDESPELLFLLRGVDPAEMIGAELAFDTKAANGSALKGNLSDIFGIDIDSEFTPVLDSGKNSRKKIARKLAEKKKKIGAKRAKKSAAKGSGALAKKRMSKGRRSKQLPSKVTAKRKSIKQSGGGSGGGSGQSGSGINIARGLRASHLKRLRANYELSVAELSRISGVSAATLHRWEGLAGVINANEKTLSLVGRVFAMSYNQAMRRLGR